MNTKDFIKKYKKKKSKDKKLNKFGVFLISYSGILVGIFLVLLVFLYGLLKDYEKSMPSHTMDKLIKEFTKDNIEQVLVDNSISVNDFESVSTIADYYREVLQDHEAFYKRKSGEYTNTSPVYLIKAGDTSIAKVTLAEGGRNGHNFTEWKVDKISIDGYIDANNEVTITAPTGAEVSLNGIKINDSYITQKDVTISSVKNVASFVTLPTNVVYKVSGLMAQPKIEATLKGTALEVKTEGKTTSISYPTDQALLDSQKSLIREIYQGYGKYIINRFSLAEASKYLVGTAKTNISDIPAVWAYLYGKTYTYEFKNENISNMVKYSDNCFTCNVAYDLIVKWNEGEKTYNTKLIYTFVKTKGAWYLADFSFDY